MPKTHVIKFKLGLIHVIIDLSLNNLSEHCPGVIFSVKYITGVIKIKFKFVFSNNLV